MKKNEKKNVLRLLDQKRIVYESHFYTNAISGLEVAAVLGQDPQQVFKTLVTIGKSGQHYVFVVPVEKELDLKKAATAAGEKAVGNDTGKRAAAAYRVCAWGMFSGRDEEVVSNSHRFLQ